MPTPTCQLASQVINIMKGPFYKSWGQKACNRFVAVTNHRDDDSATVRVAANGGHGYVRQSYR